MPPPPAGSPNVGQVTSAALFGSLFNFLLFGMLLIQVCVYKVCFPQDRRAVKAVVYAVFLMMLLSVCFNASDAHFWYAAHFGDLITFGEARLSAFYTPIIGSLIALAVQLFFCYRISMFRQAVWVAGVIALISLAQVGGGIGAGLGVYISQEKTEGRENTFVAFIRPSLFYLWLTASAVADLLIAIAMTFLLVNGAEPEMKHIVSRVVRLIIETNSFTATVAITCLALFSGFPGRTYFMCPSMVLPGVYANTLLLTLNNRASPIRTQQPTQNGRLEENSGSDTYPPRPGAHPNNRDMYRPRRSSNEYPHRSSIDKKNMSPSPPSVLKDGVVFVPFNTGKSVVSWGTSTVDSLEVEEHPYDSGSYTRWT